MRLFLFVSYLILVFSSVGTAAEQQLQPTNSTLIVKLHFDRTARKGQMVGALQIRLRNASKTPLTHISLLLNPGLQFVRVDGSGRTPLKLESNITTVAGNDALELNAATVTFSKPLDPTKQREIVIHYRGYIEDLSWAGLEGIKETLHPDFTMIRAESFAYPILASPDIASIQHAWNEKPYQQIAFIEMPGLNTVHGSLAVAEKTITAGKTEYELKTSRLVKPLALAIGAYTTQTAGPITVSALHATEAEAQAVLTVVNTYSGTVASLIGAPNNSNSVSIIEVPDGYRNIVTTGTLFKGPSFFAAPQISADIQSEIFALWRLNNRNQVGHWSTGFDTLTQYFLSNSDMPAYRNARFSDSQPLFAANKKIGKTALADYATDGFTAQSDSVSTLAFSVLHALMGDDAFFALIRGLRAELANNYGDMEAVADYLSSAVKQKAARKFVKNWFEKGRAGKDMAKAKSFTDLVARYR